MELVLATLQKIIHDPFALNLLPGFSNYWPKKEEEPIEPYNKFVKDE